MGQVHCRICVSGLLHIFNVFHATMMQNRDKIFTIANALVMSFLHLPIEMITENLIIIFPLFSGAGDDSEGSLRQCA